MRQVERRGQISYQEFLDEFGLPGRPVVLTQATRGWKALQWTPAELARRFPHQMVEVTPSASLEEALFQMPLEDYVAYLEQPDERLLYMTSWNFRDACPGLLEDFEVPEFFREDWLQEIDPEQQFDLMWLFLGPAGAGFRMHVDLAHTSAWNVQLTGRKRWLLWDPAQVEFLYQGEVDGFAPDLEQFPLYAGAEPWEAVLEAGDLIFTPSGWWHQTKNLQTGLALTANFANRTNYESVMNWLKEVGVHLEVGHDMVEYLWEFRRVVADKLGQGPQ